MYYDTDAQVVSVVTDPEDATPASVVNPLILGRPMGTVLHHECVGFTQIKVSVWSKYPFALVTKTANAKACGYVGPTEPALCQFVKRPFTITDETVRGAHDGTVTMDVVLPFGTLEYSLDNIHWQSSKTFSNLSPGLYRWYVRATNNRCKTQGTFGIGAGAPAQEIEYPWKRKYCHVFKLKVQGVEFPIAEPIKWDGVNLKGLRDKDWHGWKATYSDENVELEFDCAAGKELIQPVYDQYGADGEVFFLYGINFQGVDYIFFEAKLDLNTFKMYPEKVTATAVSVKYNPLIETRMETKVSMTALKSADEVDIAPPPITTIDLHSKELSKQIRCKSTTPFDVPFDGLTRQAVRYVYPEMSEASSTEIEDAFLSTLEISNDAFYDIERYQIKIKYAGTYSFKIAYSLNVNYHVNRYSGSITIRNYFMVNDTKQQVGEAFTDNMSKDVRTKKVDYSHTVTVNLSPGDEIYWFTQLNFTLAEADIPPNPKYEVSVSQTSIDVSVDALEAAAGSTCKGWFLFDALNHVIRSNTNGDNYVKSDFLSRANAQQIKDGDGALFITTNGKQIRNFDPDKNPLVISAKDLLDSARALFCLGKGFETVAGKEVLRIERVNYFYRDKEMLVIDECSDFYTEVAKELLYNEYEFGYEKYKSEGANTLDEFNTKQEGLFPNKTNKLKLTQKSSLIASGYSLEDSRRQQFADTPTNSFENDDEGFIISVRRDGVKYVPEKDEAFTQVSGVISPQTAYNLRLSPKRMLLNWAIWLRNVFHYKLSTDLIKPTQHVQNGALVTQLRFQDDRFVGDFHRQQINEAEPVDLSNYPVEERIYRPEWIYFKTRLTPDKIQLINNAMKGAASENVNYGWIAVKDDQGLYQAGYPYEMEYNFASEQATFKLLKKFGNPITPGEVCCKYFVVNGCRLLVNGQNLILNA
jgi:hypothetical protein